MWRWSRGEFTSAFPASMLMFINSQSAGVLSLQLLCYVTSAFSFAALSSCVCSTDTPIFSAAARTRGPAFSEDVMVLVPLREGRNVRNAR